MPLATNDNPITLTGAHDTTFGRHTPSVNVGTGAGGSTASSGTGTAVDATPAGGAALGGSNLASSVTSALGADLGLVAGSAQPFIGLVVLLAVVYFLAKGAKHLK